MNDNRFDRTELLIGSDNLKKLTNASVLVFGLGGVGGYTVEALCRGGIGNITIVDGDSIDVTNINRQIIATDSTVGVKKTDAWKKRIKDINPWCQVETFSVFYTAENSDIIDFTKFDYVVDAVDTVSSKLLIVEKAQEKNIPVISSMGTGRKLDPTRLRIDNIYKTEGCPLARVMRREARKKNLKPFYVVWSDEEPAACPATSGRDVPIGSVSFVPSVAGIYIAAKVISDITGTGGLYAK